MPHPGLLAAYLLVGTDYLKRNRAESKLKARLDQGLAAFNMDERSAATAQDPTDIAISLNTVPVGDGFRLVVIHDANKLPKPVAETIISYLENPNPDCVLLLVADTLARNTRLYKAVARVGKSAVVDCVPLKARDIPNHLMRIAKGKGINLDANAARELLSRSGEDMALLNRQIDTLAQISAQPGRITLEDVEQNVARTAEVKPWDFQDMLASRDAKGTLSLYRHMQDPSHLALVSLVTRRLRELVCAKALSVRGVGEDGIAKELGKQGWQVRPLIKNARRFSMHELEELLAKSARCERGMKSGADPENALIQLLLDVCTPA